MTTNKSEEKELIEITSGDFDDDKYNTDNGISEEALPCANISWQKSLAKRPSCKNPSTGKLQLHNYCGFKGKDFQQFGVGIYLYFRFVNQLFRLFMVMFVLSLPLVFSSLASRQIDRTQFAFEQTTIGNLGDISIEVIEYPSYVNMKDIPLVEKYVLDGNSIDKRDAGVVFAWSDLLATLVFIIFLTKVKASQAVEARIADDSQTTVADFSVRVTHLPKHFYNREELQAFFTQNWGKVVDVAMLSYLV